MECDLSTRPTSMVYQPRDWHDSLQPKPGPSESSPPPVSSQSHFTQRRRSSAAHVPPAAPPPNQPIPSLPVLASLDQDIHLAMADGSHFAPSHNSRGSNGQSVYTRPAASANLAAVAAFSQARQASSSTSSISYSSPSTAASSTDNLSDPPPPSMLHPTAISRSEPPHHDEGVSGRLLLSQPASRSANDARPSSRRALTRALELAREAVRLDSTNDNPYAAVIAYGRSVALLSEVMERVRRGEDSTESSSRRKNGRRRSVVAQEEEVKRLKAIHDTYADRMNILSLIYSIPPIPHSPSSVYTSTTSISTDFTVPPSPTSISPDSDSHMSASYTTDHHQDEPQETMDHLINGAMAQDGQEPLGSPMFVLESRNGKRRGSPSHYHPYAAAANSSDEVNRSCPPETSHVNGTATLSPTRPQFHSKVGRPRAASNLPPPVPPPSTSPPPTPEVVLPDPPLEPTPVPSGRILSRSRGNSIVHKRAGSEGRLEAVTEEGRYDGLPMQSQRTYADGEQDLLATISRRPDTPRTAKKDSHPLPPLPTPSPTATANTPRGVIDTLSKGLDSPGGQYVTQRSRGESLTVGTFAHLISPSTTMGTISLRRSKMSAPPSTTTTESASPTESSISIGSAPMPPKSAASSLPAVNTVSNVALRNRASSQPGRRPSVTNGRMSPFDQQRPPLPQTAVLRKTSYPSKTITGGQPSGLVVRTDLHSPPPIMTLIPPPAIFAGNLPTTPTSPLPTAPPSDSHLKPYHMMHLLRTTMTSKTGGYITRRLHIPQEVWSQGGAKLTNIPEKVRVVEVLCSALEEMEQCSAEAFGAGNVCSGFALGIGSVGRKEAEAWVAKLEEFSSVCDSVVANFGKKLGVGEGFVVKKSGGVTSWGGKLTRQFDKFTNGKNLDSPAAYVAGLNKLFLRTQLLDEHTRAILSQPPSPIYAAFPPDIRTSADIKLRRSSEFFATVVLTFVIRDLAQLLDKYAKKCEKWLAE